MKHKVGIHAHELSNPVHNAVLAIRPRGVILLDPTAQHIRDTRLAIPNGYIGVRKYENRVDFWDRDPVVWADELITMCGDALPLVDGAICYNEPLPEGHDNFEHMRMYDEWQLRVINRLHSAGLTALAFAFGSGQFTAAPDRVNVAERFPLSCQACTTIAPHDYGWPSIWTQEGWHALRWLKWLEDIEAAGFGPKKVVVSEWGLTQAVIGGPDDGWRSGVSQEDYMRQMCEYNARMCELDNVLFFAPFDWGGTRFSWGSFEHVPEGDTSVVDTITTFQCIKEEPTMFENVAIYDFDHSPESGVTTTEQWLRDTFGDVQLRNIEDKTGLDLQEGDLILKLVYLDARSDGDANIVIHVEDEDGIPCIGQTVVFGWEDAPPHDLPLQPWHWTTHGVTGETNDNGDMGTGYGPGAYYNPAEGERGPHFVWLSDFPADYTDGLGMLTLTNHHHLNLGYKLTRYQANGPSPPPPPPPNGIAARLMGISRELEDIAAEVLALDVLAEELAERL